MGAVSPRTGIKHGGVGSRAHGRSIEPEGQLMVLPYKALLSSLGSPEGVFQPCQNFSNNERLWVPTEAAHFLIVRSLGGGAVHCLFSSFIEV